MNNYYKAKDSMATNKSCVPLEKFGAIDEKLHIPYKLIPIIDNFMQHLNNEKWTNIIINEMQHKIPTADEIRSILDKNDNEHNLHVMTMILTWFFRMDFHCYNQNRFSHRFIITESLAEACKYLFCISNAIAIIIKFIQFNYLPFFYQF